MSRVNPYASIDKRTFASALLHLLETEYGLLGGRRILQLLVEDVQHLVDEFYPATDRAASGTLIWTCTADEGRKAEPGKRTEDYQTVTVRLPLVTTADLQDRTQGQTPRGQTAAKAQARDRKRLARLVQAAAAQGGLLTIAELSVLLNKSYEVVRQYAREWEEETGELLPLKGYRMDQGSRPTHKREIARLSEQGQEPPDIARETAHSVKSVERYLQDYERVRLLLKRGLTVEDISAAIGRGKRVVLEYVALAREYHPELFETENEGSYTARGHKLRFGAGDRGRAWWAVGRASSCEDAPNRPRRESAGAVASPRRGLNRLPVRAKKRKSCPRRV